MSRADSGVWLTRLAILSTLTLLVTATGCYRHHLLPADAAVGADAGRRVDAAPEARPMGCPGERCARVDPLRPRIEVRAAGLVGNVEGHVSGLRGVPDVDGVAFELDPCAARGEAACPTTITVANVGADIAVASALRGAVEATVRDRAIVVHADPCPGCADGHVVADLLFAAVSGELSPGFDRPLGDVTVEGAGVVCESRGAAGESSARFQIAFTHTVNGDRWTLDEGDTRRFAGWPPETVLRLVRSSFECLGPDLAPPRALEAAEWVIWLEGSP